MPYAIDLSGHRALVTGAGQGVGRGIAMTLGEAGAEVLVNDLVLERAQIVVSEIELAGGKGRPAVFDVTDYDAVRAAAAPRPWATRTSPRSCRPSPTTGSRSSR